MSAWRLDTDPALTPPSCKQVMTIALAVFLFDLSVTPINGLGIVLTLVGGVSEIHLSKPMYVATC